MKKNEIKSDPVRNFLISFISKVKENSLQYLGGFLLLTAGFITLTISTSKTSPSDRSFCADSRIADMDIFKEHCASLGEYSTSAEELIFSVIDIVDHKDSEKSLTLKQKITKMEKKIWAIGGGKGGVGKSYVAGNLGILLAQKGHKPAG